MHPWPLSPASAGCCAFAMRQLLYRPDLFAIMLAKLPLPTHAIAAQRQASANNIIVLPPDVCNKHFSLVFHIHFLSLAKNHQILPSITQSDALLGIVGSLAGVSCAPPHQAYTRLNVPNCESSCATPGRPVPPSVPARQHSLCHVMNPYLYRALQAIIASCLVPSALCASASNALLPI